MTIFLRHLLLHSHSITEKLATIIKPIAVLLFFFDYVAMPQFTDEEGKSESHLSGKNYILSNNVPDEATTCVCYIVFQI